MTTSKWKEYIESGLEDAEFDGKSILQLLESGTELDGQDELESYSPDELIALLTKAILLVYHREKELNQLDKKYQSAIQQYTEVKKEYVESELRTLKHRTINKIFVKLIPKVRAKALSDNGSKGGKARSEKYDPLKEFISKKCSEQNFPSRRNAAITLKPKVLDLAQQIGVSLSEMQAEKTITEWLKDMGLPANR